MCTTKLLIYYVFKLFVYFVLATLLYKQFIFYVYELFICCVLVTLFSAGGSGRPSVGPGTGHVMRAEMSLVCPGAMKACACNRAKQSSIWIS